jgi:hypothetical protein
LNEFANLPHFRVQGTDAIFRWNESIVESHVLQGTIPLLSGRRVPQASSQAMQLLHSLNQIDHAVRGKGNQFGASPHI